MEMFNYIVTLQMSDSFRDYVFITLNILTGVPMFLHLLSHLVVVDYCFPSPGMCHKCGRNEHGLAYVIEPCTPVGADIDDMNVIRFQTKVRFLRKVFKK